MTPTHVVIVIPAGEARDVFAAADAPQKRDFRNRGPGDATFKHGADAGPTSLQLLAGERRAPRFRTGLRLSVYSAEGTTIEGESWS